MMSSDEGENHFRNLLFDSVKREEELRRLLDAQLIRNEQLQLQLDMERRKTAVEGLKSFTELSMSFHA